MLLSERPQMNETRVGLRQSPPLLVLDLSGAVTGFSDGVITAHTGYGRAGAVVIFCWIFPGWITSTAPGSRSSSAS